jgi:hypothetical protein
MPADLDEGLVDDDAGWQLSPQIVQLTANFSFQFPRRA